MNFKQIRLLNNLEKRVTELESKQETGSSKVDNHLIDELIERISRLESPPKKRPGRPRKVNAE